MEQTKKIYVLFYINVDEPKYSEVLGIYSSKESAVDNLLEVANYREKEGKLTQYMETTDEYPSLEFLREKVMNDMELHDVDIYRIQLVSNLEQSLG